MTACHSDLLFGKGVMTETLDHFVMEAVKKGTNEAWVEAHDRTAGIEYLWIVYQHRMGNRSNTGLFESIAISNQMRRLMNGMDRHEFTPGEAAKHRASAKEAWDAIVQKRSEAA